jgi:predicted HicB family RNase H-like nuclease
MAQLISLCVVIDLGEIRISIPDELHQALKMKALKERKSLKEIIIELLQKGVK